MHHSRMRWRVRLRGCAWLLVLVCWLCACALVLEGAGGMAAAAATADERERVEQGLLSLLGLPRRPRPRPRRDAPVNVPEHMRRLYERARDAKSLGLPAHGMHTGPANTVRSFIHEESKIDLRFPDHHKFRLHFNLSGIPADESLRAAELILQPSRLWDTGQERQRVLLYDLVRPGRKSKGRSPILRLIDSREASEGEVRLDVLSAARRWTSEPTHNYGVVVHVANKDGVHSPRPRVRLRRAADEEESSWRESRPLMLLFTEDGRAREARGERARRAAPPRRAHRRKNGHEACRRRPLFVDFADVGWSDWIVAPNGYEAFYCQGDCSFPLADHLNVTNHAVVQTLVNSVNPAAVPKACCVPTQLSSISMLYLDEENKVVLKNYQDMAVVGCGCR